MDEKARRKPTDETKTLFFPGGKESGYASKIKIKIEPEAETRPGLQQVLIAFHLWRFLK